MFANIFSIKITIFYLFILHFKQFLNTICVSKVSCKSFPENLQLNATVNQAVKTNHNCTSISCQNLFASVIIFTHGWPVEAASGNHTTYSILITPTGRLNMFNLSSITNSDAGRLIKSLWLWFDDSEMWTSGFWRPPTLFRYTPMLCTCPSEEAMRAKSFWLLPSACVPFICVWI